MQPNEKPQPQSPVRDREIWQAIESAQSSRRPQYVRLAEGRAVVIQDAEAYEQLVDDAELADSVPKIREALDRWDSKDEWLDAVQVIRDFAASRGIELSGEGES